MSPSRGLLKFIPVPEDCLASGGMTVSGEMEMAEKGAIAGDGLPLSRSFTPGVTGTEEGGSLLSMKKSKGRMTLNVKVRKGPFLSNLAPPENRAQNVDHETEIPGELQTSNSRRP